MVAHACPNLNFSCPTSGGALRVSTATGEPDDGDYATLRGPNGDLLHLSNLHPDTYNNNNDHADDTSEEGKLLACVRDDSVTYASTRDLEPPMSSATLSPATSYITSPDHRLMSPVSVVTVHSTEVHVSFLLLNQRQASLNIFFLFGFCLDFNSNTSTHSSS